MRRLTASAIRLTAILTLLVCLQGTVAAQSGSTRGEAGTGGGSVIRGRIYLPSGGTVGRRKVTLFFERRGDEISVMCDPSGQFTFDGLQNGSYVITIDGGDEYETAREVVEITEYRRGSVIARLPIYMTPKKSDKASTGGKVVAAAALDPTVPAEARQHYTAATEAAQRGDARKAAELFEKAVAVYPKFLAAHEERGVQYLKLGELDKAIEAFRAAIALNENAASAHLRLGEALLERRTFDGAREHLEKAASLENASARTHLSLGIAYIGLRNLEASEKELRRALELDRGSAVLAHYYLGGIYMAWRQNDRAADELEIYLRDAPKPKDPDRVRKTIADLRGKKG
jgi:Tfp pilus assembly protein PilF